jgi:hypothetical protein
MHAIVHGADIQDRDGGALLMATLFGAFPFLLTLYADGGYQGPEFQAAMRRTMTQVNVEIVKRSDPRCVGTSGAVVWRATRNCPDGCAAERSREGCA